jgi:hypothetical protein
METTLEEEEEEDSPIGKVYQMKADETYEMCTVFYVFNLWRVSGHCPKLVICAETRVGLNVKLPLPFDIRVFPQFLQANAGIVL